jgi:CheY-like chemotaxis protein
MASVLEGKKILAVDDEPDILSILQEEIKSEAPNCHVDEATTYEEALKMMDSEKYDIVILDIMGVRGFDLLDHAQAHHFPVAMLTAHALSAENLKRSIQKGARAYLPKEKLGEIVPFLEDILEVDAPTGWNRLFNRLDDFFDHRFGPDWNKSDDRFWQDFKGEIQGPHGRVVIK